MLVATIKRIEDVCTHPVAGSAFVLVGTIDGVTPPVILLVGDIISPPPVSAIGRSVGLGL